MRRIALTALFALTTWFGQAQNLTVSINGGTALTDKASLEAAVTNSGVPLAEITSIEVMAGDFSAADWMYLANNRDAISSLQSFAITNGISSVADMPSLNWVSCFSPSINEVSVDASFAIGACAFYECRNLASISMPKATSVGSRAFYDCSSLTSVDLPSATTIDYEAFCYCSALTTVSLPAAISIFNNAFEYCYVLADVDLPVATSIGMYAFHYCRKLTTVSLPAATNIDSWAFQDCALLAFLELGTTPPTLGYNTFGGCASPRCLKLVDADGNPLTGDALNSAVEAYKSIDDGDPTDNLWYGWRINDPIIPLTVKLNGGTPTADNASLEAAIASSGLALADITSIEITAGDFLADNWEYLSQNRRALSSLTKFTIADGITSVADMPDKYSWDACFAESTVEEVYIAKLEKIGSYAFYYCTALTTVSLPAATSINHYEAFGSCGQLTFLELGDTPPSANDYTFNGCASPRYLKLIDADGNPLTGDALNSAVEAYRNIDDGDPTDNLWYGWRINEQPAPFTVKVNGQSAEHSAPTLQEAIALSGEAPARITQLQLLSGDLRQSDADYMVNSLTALQRLTLTAATEFNVRLPHPSLTELYAPLLENVGDWAFRYCYALTSVSLPAATSIGYGAFEECGLLTFLELGDTPPSASDYTFNGCASPRYLKLIDADGNPLTGDALNSAVEAYRNIDDGDPTDNLWYGWRINEQPAPFTVKVNGQSAEHSAPTLQQAIALSGIASVNVTQLQLLSGDLRQSDADYMENSLTGLQRLTLATATEFNVRLPHQSLTELYAPLLENVGDWAFYDCSALTSVSLPAATSIGTGAFCGCLALTTVSLPAATSIGGSAFSQCTTLTAVSLPAATSIGSGAFSNCSALTTVDMPVATSIGTGAFRNCSTLTTVSLPAATSIGYQAFYYCSALTTVSLPSATNIGDMAFDNCSMLTFLELGTTPPTLGDRVFNYCPSPRYLAVDDSAADDYRAVDDGDDTDNLWHGWSINEQPAQLTIKVNGQSQEHSAPSLQEAIALSGEDAASITQLEVLSGDLRQSDADYMVNSLTALQRLTLTEATEFGLQLQRHPSLQEIHAPQLEIVGSSAFYYCSALTTVSLPAATSIGRYAFENCYSLTTVSLPAATSIGSQAFNNCSALTTVSLPAATNIGDYVFAGCSMLTFLELGTTPPTLGDRVFNYCPSPRYLAVDDSAADDYRAVDDGDDTDNLWHGWSINEQPAQLTIKVNGQSQEYSAPSLQEAIALSGEDAASITQLELLSGDLLQSDAYYMVNSLTALQRLILTTATEFGLQLQNHPSLQEIHAPQLEIVGDWAFHYCSALTSVNLPAATSIGTSAFSYCSALTTVSLLAATSIGMEAFIYCTALDSVNIQSATSIAVGAFYGCSNLTFLELGATPPSLGDRVFNYCPSPRYLTVDASAEDAYRNIDDGDTGDNLWHGWRINEQPAQFTVKVNGLDAEHSAPTLQEAIALSGEEVASITQLELLSGDLRQSDADYMMNSLTALQRLTLTAATEFNVRLNHPSLQEFYAPCVTTLGPSVFAHSSLTTVSLPTATSIGMEAFLYCTALNSVNIQSVISIEGGAFDGCSMLTFLELGATPPTLGNNAFRGCPSPRYLTVDASAEDAYRNIDDGDPTDNLWHGWRINEQPAQLTIKVNGLDAEHSAPSLQEAIALSGEDAASITQLEVLSGDLLGADANYMRNSLTALQRLILTTATEFGLGLGHRSLQEVYAPMLEIVGEYAFSGCYALTSLELTATPPTVASSAFGDCPSPRYLKLVDANGNPLTGTERTTAIANYKGDSNWSNRTSTWCGWSIEMSITATANIAESGTVSGTGNMPSGATATLQATPSAGYRFVRWTDGTNELSTDNPYSFIVTDDAELVAEFEKQSSDEGGSNTGLFDIRRESLTAYPNPTTGMLWVSVPEPVEGTAANVLLYNIAGQLLQRVPARAASAGSAASRMCIDLSGYPDGMYFIHVGNAVAKVVKQ